MTKQSHMMHLFIESVAEKHGVSAELDTESRKLLMNIMKSIQFMGEDGMEMVVLAFLVGYDKGQNYHGANGL